MASYEILIMAGVERNIAGVPHESVLRILESIQALPETPVPGSSAVLNRSPGSGLVNIAHSPKSVMN